MPNLCYIDLMTKIMESGKLKVNLKKWAKLVGTRQQSCMKNQKNIQKVYKIFHFW